MNPFILSNMNAKKARDLSRKGSRRAARKQMKLILRDIRRDAKEGWAGNYVHTGEVIERNFFRMKLRWLGFKAIEVEHTDEADCFPEDEREEWLGVWWD